MSKRKNLINQITKAELRRSLISRRAGFRRVRINVRQRFKGDSIDVMINYLKL